AVFFYAMLNFFVGIVLIVGASPGKVRQTDARFMLARPGAVELEVGHADEDRSQARMSSGYWMVFYLGSAAGIIDARRRARAEADARRGTFLPPTARGSRYTLHPSPRLTPAVHA